MVRFLHTADWQIGMTRRHLGGEAQARFSAARIDAIRRIGDLARDQRCDFVVVCGDVFETNQLSRQTVGRALEALATVPVPVYLLPGNHDPLDPLTIYRSPQFVRDCPAHVHVLDSSEPVSVGDGVELIPAPWSGKHPDHDLVGASVTAALASGRMPTAASADPLRIVVGHGAVDLLDPDRHNRGAIALEPLETELAAGRIHYVALGDRHSRTSVGDSGAVWYSGAPEVTDHRETQPGDVLIVELTEGQRPEVTAHHIGTWTFRTIRREVSGARDVSALASELSAIADKDRTVVRLALQGVLGVADHAALSDLLDEQGEVFAALHQWDRHTNVSISADGAQLSDLQLGGFVSAAAEEMRDLAVTEETPAGARELGDEQADDDASQHDDSNPLAWEFVPDAEDDQRSAADALSLLYRLAREEAR
ncbi:metallophosphoesterase family protein [Ornithinimicrobium faecis]|uniref:metallophosphoesterase family protein n=1 Tax=Ornithinimicrobium faecis TaxID=2934158 RepID=UPI0021197639|nr:metallophosphoesterase [Ornithinimicrobium sp. HY1745]